MALQTVVINNITMMIMAMMIIILTKYMEKNVTTRNMMMEKTME